MALMAGRVRARTELPSGILARIPAPFPHDNPIALITARNRRIGKDRGEFVGKNGDKLPTLIVAG